MKTEAIACDRCGADLRYSSSNDYRLRLSAETMPGYPDSPTFDILPTRPIKRDHHFCHMECLAKWLAVYFENL